MNSEPLFGRVLTTASLLATCCCANAQVQSDWLLPVDGDWTDPTNWSTDPVYPNSFQQGLGDTDDASIGAAGSPYTVRLGSGAPRILVYTLTIDSPDATLLLDGPSGDGLVAITRLNLGPGTLIVDADRWIDSDDYLLNGGSIFLGQASTGTMYVTDGDAGDGLRGTGEVVFAGSGAGNLLRLNQSTNGLLIDPGITIRTGGNDGLIEFANTVVNSGRILADGNTVTIEPYAFFNDPVWDNTNGVFEVKDGGTILADFYYSQADLGELRFTNGGTMDMTGYAYLSQDLTLNDGDTLKWSDGDFGSTGNVTINDGGLFKFGSGFVGINDFVINAGGVYEVADYYSGDYGSIDVRGTVVVTNSVVSDSFFDHQSPDGTFIISENATFRIRDQGPTPTTLIGRDVGALELQGGTITDFSSNNPTGLLDAMPGYSLIARGPTTSTILATDSIFADIELLEGAELVFDNATINSTVNVNPGTRLTLQGGWENLGNVIGTDAVIAVKNGPGAGWGSFNLNNAVLRLENTFLPGDITPSIIGTNGRVGIGQGGVLDNTGNTLVLDSAALQWSLDGGKLLGGRVEPLGTDTFEVFGTGNVVESVEMAATFNVNPDADLTILGSGTRNLAGVTATDAEVNLVGTPDVLGSFDLTRSILRLQGGGGTSVYQASQITSAITGADSAIAVGNSVELDVTGSSIQIDSTGLDWQLEGGTIRGGTFTSASSEAFSVTGSGSIIATHFQTQVHLNGQGQILLSEGVTANQGVQFNGLNTALVLAENQTLDGFGEIVLGSSGSNLTPAGGNILRAYTLQEGATAFPTLVVPNGMTIRVTDDDGIINGIGALGTLGSYANDLVVQGTLVSDGPESQFRVNGNTINLDNALLQAPSGGQFFFTGNVQNNGNLNFGPGDYIFFSPFTQNEANPIAIAQGGSLDFAKGFYGSGAFTGEGALVFSQTVGLGPNNGHPRENIGAAILTTEGDVEFGRFSSTFFELGGIELGQFDRFEVGGDLLFEEIARLNVRLIDDFLLSKNMEFVIVDVDGVRTGEFYNRLQGTSSGGNSLGFFGAEQLFIRYDAGDGNDIALYTESALIGDANGDGQVSLLDLDVLGQHYGGAGTWADGDFNADGQVSLIDLDLLGQNYGTGAASSVAPLSQAELFAYIGQPVPEPSSLALLGLAGLMICRRRR